MEIDYVYLIRSHQDLFKNSTFSPVCKTKKHKKKRKHKRIIFTNEKDYKEVWIQDYLDGQAFTEEKKGIINVNA